jgi:hypothetical protein
LEPLGAVALDGLMCAEVAVGVHEVVGEDAAGNGRVLDVEGGGNSRS